MTRKAYILLAFILAMTFAVRAQVKITTVIDSTEMLIGEQTAVRINVEHPKNLQPVFPKALQQLMKKGVEVVGDGITSEEEDVPANGINTTHFTYTITSFEPALYSIPSINVKVGKQVYTTEQLALKVNDVKVDTAHVDKFFGPKEIIDPVYTWRDWIPLFLLSLLLIACAVGVWISARRLLITKAIKVVKAKKQTPLLPHKEAEMEIAKLKEEYTSEDLSSKDYYTSLIDILRRYVSKRYGFRADEMTSFELVEHLIELGDKAKQQAQTEPMENQSTIEPEPDYTELREILETADLTKFAKLQTDSNEDEQNLRRLSSYIEKTKSDIVPTILDVVEKETDIVLPKNPRTKKKVVLGLAIFVTAFVFALIILELFELLL